MMRVLARRDLRQKARLQGGQIGEAVRKQRGTALFVICHSLPACKMLQEGFRSLHSNP